MKRVEDVLKAVEFGADAVGFLVGQLSVSDDFVTKEHAREMIRALPPFCSSVLVTHLSDLSEIMHLTKVMEVSTVQLHGDSTPSDAVKLKEKFPFLKVLKMIHVIDKSCVENAKSFEKVVDAILLDSFEPSTGRVGGTGLTHDWGLSRRIVEEVNLPVVLAGGLNPDNVQEAISKVKPFGVDVQSSLKGQDGFKDFNKMRLFIERAKSS
ncbi:MAG: phosphoribosylanthranilate isomerase [Candidatus Diapherotrites archaeon]|nr:phosphoribosylanthranilate isomerase [Candidatus Diapherotrites archaeon]